MDFNFKKPTHILALILILSSIIVILFLPIMTFFGFLPSTSSIDLDDLSRGAKLIFEITMLFSQLIIVIVLLVLFPILWYVLVNNYSIKKTLKVLKLKFKNIKTPIIWGLLSAFLMYFLIIIFEIFFRGLGVKTEDLGNIEDIEMFFSPVSMFILFTIQPMTEEFFFRGFLLEKISKYSGDYTAVLITAILFGIAHLTYNKPYLAVSIIIMGLILGIIVIKTKNLFTAIIAHTFFNLGSFILYILTKYYI